MSRSCSPPQDPVRWRVLPMHDGRVLRYREDLLDDARAGTLPFTMRVIWPFAPGADGHPGGAAQGAMDLFAGRLEANAAEAGVGLLAAEVTGGGVREWVWLTASAAGLGGIVNALMHEFEDVEVDVEPAHDPAWSHFRSLVAAAD